jgi:hypothetical protein
MQSRGALVAPHRVAEAATTKCMPHSQFLLQRRVPTLIGRADDPEVIVIQD